MTGRELAVLRSVDGWSAAALDESGRSVLLGGACGASFGRTIAADLWVDSDGLARRFQATSSFRVPRQPAQTWSVSYELSDFGLAQPITFPADGDIVDGVTLHRPATTPAPVAPGAHS